MFSQTIDADASAVMERMLNDAYCVAGRRPIDAADLQSTLVDAFANRTTAAWVAVFMTLQDLERNRTPDADPAALARIRAFLYDNADLAEALVDA